MTPTAVSAPAAAPTPAPTPPLIQPSVAPVVTGVANGDNHGTKVELQTSYLALIAGLQQNFQPGDVFDLMNGQVTCSQLVSMFQGFVATAQSTKGSYQTWRDDVQAERAAEQQVRPYRTALKAVFVGKYGKSSTKLLQYGFQPAKVPATSTAARSTAVAKAKATREARGTKGKRQKQQIVGNVTGVVITPVTAGPPVPVTGGSSSSSTGNHAASGSNGAGAPAAPASPAGSGGTPPHA